MLLNDLVDWLPLTLAAVLTSIVSGVMGMAGGMLLLAVMLLRLEPAVAIPLHGIVQTVSNGSRAWFLRRHVRFGAGWRFAWPLLPIGRREFLGATPLRHLRRVVRIGTACTVR